jgi:hypothetical protein
MRRTLSVLALGLLASCSNTTGGALIKLPFSVGGVERPAPGPLTFSTAAGWTVTLEQARLSLGPYYFNVSPPSGAAFRTGVVIDQVTRQVVVDPLDPTLVDVVGGADGETGVAVAVEMGLTPPDTSQTAEVQALLGDAEAYVLGSATKAGVTVPFAGFVTIDISQASPQKPVAALQRIIGSFEQTLTFTAAPQQLSLRVDPGPWFDATDFSLLLTSPPGADGNYTWDNKSTFHGELLQGIQTLTGYNFTVQPR